MTTVLGKRPEGSCGVAAKHQKLRDDDDDDDDGVELWKLVWEQYGRRSFSGDWILTLGVDVCVPDYVAMRLWSSATSYGWGILEFHKLFEITTMRQRRQWVNSVRHHFSIEQLTNMGVRVIDMLSYDRPISNKIDLPTILMGITCTRMVHEFLPAMLARMSIQHIRDVFDSCIMPYPDDTSNSPHRVLCWVYIIKNLIKYDALTYVLVEKLWMMPFGVAIMRFDDIRRLVMATITFPPYAERKCCILALAHDNTPWFSAIMDRNGNECGTHKHDMVDMTCLQYVTVALGDTTKHGSETDLSRMMHWHRNMLALAEVCSRSQLDMQNERKQTVREVLEERRVRYSSFMDYDTICARV